MFAVVTFTLAFKLRVSYTSILYDQPAFALPAFVRISHFLFTVRFQTISMGSLSNMKTVLCDWSEALNSSCLIPKTVLWSTQLFREIYFQFDPQKIPITTSRPIFQYIWKLSFRIVRWGQRSTIVSTIEKKKTWKFECVFLLIHS